MKTIELKSSVIALLLAVTASMASAQTVIWSGAPDMDWNQPDSTSWSGSTFNSGYTAQFGDLGAGTVNITNSGVTPGSVIVNSTQNYIFSGGGIGGSATLTKSGSGTLVIQSDNSFVGAVVVDGGYISVGTIANGGVNSPLGASSSAAANLRFAGGGITFTGSANGSTDRNFTIGSGGATINASGSGSATLTMSGSIAYDTPNVARALTLRGSNTGGINVFSGLIADNGSGPVSLTKADYNNIWWLTNPNNSFSGGVVINRGTLIFSSGALGASGAITIGSNYATPPYLKWASGNTNDISARFSLATGYIGFDTGGNDVTFSSSLTLGFAWVFKDGAGSLTLNGGSGTYSGPTLISGGTLVAVTLDIGGANSSIGKSPAAAANLGLRGGTLKYTGSGATTDRNFFISASSAIDASGTGPLIFSQTGAISPTPVSRTTTSSGNLTLITGLNNTSDLVAGMKVAGTGISAGTTITAINNNSQISISQSTSGLVNPTTLTFGNYSPGTPITLTLTGSNTNANEIRGILRDSVSAIVGDTGATNTQLGVTKSGVGQWVISGVNTYSGATTIKEGVLLGFVGGSCSNSAVIVTNTPGSISALRIGVTNDAMQWTCSSMTFKPNGAGAQLQFNYSGIVGTTTAPLKILGDLAFDGIPAFVVDAPDISPGTYPLITVGANIPGQFPVIVVSDLESRGLQSRLSWSGQTLQLHIAARGTAIFIR